MAGLGASEALAPCAVAAWEQPQLFSEAVRRGIQIAPQIAANR